MFVCSIFLLHSLLVSSPHDVEDDDGESKWNTICLAVSCYGRLEICKESCNTHATPRAMGIDWSETEVYAFSHRFAGPVQLGEAAARRTRVAGV